jgi:hypothetical protein
LACVVHSGPDQVWQVNEAVRRVADWVGLLFVVIALVATAIGLGVAEAVAMWALAILLILSVWRWYLVPYVALTDDHVVVQGVFARRTVAYGAIRRARPGLYGMRIETEDQGTVTAWAVQKSKFAEWTHRHTSADDVVAAIMDRVQGAHDALDAPEATPARSR